MKRPTLTQLMLACLLLSFSLQGLQAQSGNLIENAGFEDFDTDSEGQNVASGWQPWNMPITEDSPDYERVPQYDAASNVEGRIQSDDEAQVIFTDFYYTFSAGIYQQVEGVEPGDELTFSADVYIWSSTLDDPDVSEESSNVLVYVGIDPSGGTDGTSEDIVWSIAILDQYDEYVGYSVTAEAEAETVTAFVWVDSDFAARNTFAYIDDAVLEAAATAVVMQPTEDATTPEVTEVVELTEEAAEVVEATEAVSVSPPEVTEATSAEATQTAEVVEATEAVSISPPEVTEAAEPTEAVEPSATSTAIPTQTVTNSPMPAETTTATPTEEIITEVSPVPTDEDIGIIVAPTETDVPTVTDAPTNTAQATNTEPPVPTTTPLPTQTNVPTSTATTVPTETETSGNVIESVEITQEVEQLPAVEAAPTETFGTGGVVSDDRFQGQIGHTVQPNETVQQIAQLYGSSSEQIIEVNNLNDNGLIFVGDELIVPVPFEAGQLPEPSDTPVIIIVTATPTTEVGTVAAIDTSNSDVYVVQPGDTLSLIADFFDTTVTDLAQRNGIANSNQISVGQQILVPADVEPTPTDGEPEATGTHTVRYGENLYRIALRYGVTVGELQQANNLFNPNAIYAGQVLLIP